MRQRAKARRFSGSDSGAGLVEFALILPLLMMLVLGLFTGGLAYNRKISITASVREGARFGATLACSASCVSAGTLVTQVKQRVADNSSGELAPADVCAAIVLAPDASPPKCGVADPAGSAGTYIVKVSAAKEATIDALVFRRALTLSSRSAARYERESTYNQ